MTLQNIKCFFGFHRYVKVEEIPKTPTSYWVYSACDYCLSPMSVHPQMWEQMLVSWRVSKGWAPFPTTTQLMVNNALRITTPSNER